MTKTLPLLDCCQPLGASELTDREAEATAELFKALSDPARVKIVNMLATCGCEVCACDFEPEVGVSQATVSHHLKKLTDAGLVIREQRGKWAYFRLDPKAMKQLTKLVNIKGGS